MQVFLMCAEESYLQMKPSIKPFSKYIFWHKVDIYVPVCCKCFLKWNALKHFYSIQYNKTVLIWWYAVSQQDAQQLLCPHNLHAIKVVSFVPAKEIS